VELAAEVVEAHGVAVEVAHPEDEETRIDGAPVLLFLWLFLLLMSEHLMRNNLCRISIPPRGNASIVEIKSKFQ
jgi:hypothetical protein